MCDKKPSKYSRYRASFYSYVVDLSLKRGGILINIT